MDILAPELSPAQHMAFSTGTIDLQISVRATSDGGVSISVDLGCRSVLQALLSEVSHDDVRLFVRTFSTDR